MMQKTVVKILLENHGRQYEFYCDHESPIEHIVEVCEQLKSYVEKVKEEILSKQEQQPEESVVEVI